MEIKAKCDVYDRKLKDARKDIKYLQEEREKENEKDRKLMIKID